MPTPSLPGGFIRNSLLLRSCTFPSIYLFSSSKKRLFSNGIIQENDIVILKRSGSPGTLPVLTGPLTSRGRIPLFHDAIFHSHIIGKEVRDIIKTKKGKEYRVHQPSMAEYTDNTPRLVTPIYSQDAHATLSLLDIHVTTPGSKQDTGRFEIFEAGTGHGALTLNLARAIHAANTTPPPLPERIYVSKKPAEASIQSKRGTSDTNESPKLTAASHEEESNANTESVQEIELGPITNTVREAYQQWRENRRAVIHTLDISSPHSRHAEKTVKGFRDGIYFPHVDFHVGLIDEYITKRLSENGGTPFLDHAILDLPSCQAYLELLSKALKPAASLLVFCPNITQINTCVLDVKSNRYPLYLDTVMELGAGTGVGGREWDVRPVRPRAFLKARADAAERKHNGQEPEGTEDETLSSEEADDDADGWELVCRPKVGQRVIGGGFIAQWRKTTPPKDLSSQIVTEGGLKITRS